MGDDVICIDSDDDDEDEAVPSAAGSALNARAAFGRHGGRNWRQRRRAQRGRKNDSTMFGNNTPLAKLLDGLRWLSSDMYFGEWAGKSAPDFPFHSLAQRVRSLVAEFQRYDTTVAARTEGWRQVVRFLVLLRTVGLTETPTHGNDDPGCDKHLREDDKQSIADVSRSRTNHKPKQPGSHLSTIAVCCNREKARQTRRYQLTVIDILADYIRFRCETVARFHPPIRPGALLKECNRIVGSMFVIFDGSMELMTLALLRIVPDRATHTLLLYPVFENILTSAAYHSDYDTIPGYVRMLLCFKRWKSLVSGRAEKASIDAQAVQLLPGRCPTVQHASDLPFLRLLPPIPPGQRVVETRYLLVNDLFSLEHCIAQYLRHHRRTVGGPSVDESAPKQRDNNSIRQRPLAGSRNDIFSGDEREPGPAFAFVTHKRANRSVPVTLDSWPGTDTARNNHSNIHDTGTRLAWPHFFTLPTNFPNRNMQIRFNQLVEFRVYFINQTRCGRDHTHPILYNQLNCDNGCDYETLCIVRKINKKQHTMEIRSNYINVSLLAELIERKSQLWARAFPTPPDMILHPGRLPSLPDRCLQQEVHSIIESLRLIFRNRAEFIELTLLRVKPYPCSTNLLGPVFEAFLGTAAATPCSASPAIAPTGLTIYRSNDVETYGRLMLCYAKWKSLYWTTVGMDDDPTEWASIDAVALTQLPYDFPRSICPRDALLRRIFPIVAMKSRTDSITGVAPTDGKRNNVTTRTLLRILPKRPDLQELCLKFIQAYRCGSDATPPMDDQQDQQEAKPPTTNTAAYKSMSASAKRSLRWHLSSDVSGQPTFQAHQQTEWRSEMKPIIIPDSDDADETSTNDAIAMLVKESDHNIPEQNIPRLRDTSTPRSNDPCYPMAVSTGNDTCTATGMDRNSPTTPTDEFVTDSTATPVPAWSPFAECFLNTPPATPQYEMPPEVVDEEQRRVVLVKKSFPSPPSWARLKGTIRLIGQRKKRISAARIAKRVLLKIFAHDGWWNFADVLAIKLHSSTRASRWSSIMNDGITGNDCTMEVKDMLTNDRLELLSALPDGSAVDSRRSSGKADDDRAKNDALLHELIDCLGAVDTMPLDSKQGYVDFAILPDNPGYGAERSLTDTVDDQASPPVCGTCVDTSPLFAADSDKYVLLFTELGPVSWPIV